MVSKMVLFFTVAGYSTLATTTTAAAATAATCIKCTYTLSTAVDIYEVQSSIECPDKLNMGAKMAYVAILSCSITSASH